MVVAASENNVIGIKGELPWHLPEDLKFFKQKTQFKPVLMGRKTFESLGRALPNRLNIVLSGGEPQLPEGVLLFHSIDEAVKTLEERKVEEVCIIGGGQIFEQAMNIADTIYITRVHTTIEAGDAFFPEIDHTHWKLVWEEAHEADDKHKYAYTFQQYEHISL